MFYDVSGRPYPELILGADRFIDIFPKPRPSHLLTQEHVLGVMEAAYRAGCRGFDLNTASDNVLSAFDTIKARNRDAVGIGDPNWRCGFKLGDSHLMDLKGRVIRTVVERRLDVDSLGLVERLPAKNRSFFFGFPAEANALTDQEISQIWIDEHIWCERLERLRNSADFCLVGADYADWLVALGREDLLEWQVRSVSDRGMIPVAVFHWASLTLPAIHRLRVGACWTLGNREVMYLSTDSAVSAIQASSLPVTCFRVLRGIRIPDQIPETVEWLVRHVGARSLVIGADDSSQAAESFGMASRVMSSLAEGVRERP